MAYVQGAGRSCDNRSLTSMHPFPLATDLSLGFFFLDALFFHPPFFFPF